MQRDTTSPEAESDQPSPGDASVTKAQEASSETGSGESISASVAEATMNRAGSARRQVGQAGSVASAKTRVVARTGAMKVPTPGDELEIRLARMYFWNGAYSRHGVNLQRHFHPEPLLVTDLDLLALHLTPDLALSKVIGEAKTGTGKSAPKPLDRAIWVAGLKQLVRASGGVLVTVTKPSARVRETAQALGVRAFSVEDIERWERAHLPPVLADVGAHGSGAFAAAQNARIMAKGEPLLERVYWFLRSEVWFLDSWQAAKRLIGALGELRGYWTPSIDDRLAAALRWMYAEVISVLTLHLVVLVGIYRSWDARDWSAFVKDRLAEGAVPAYSQRAMADAFDKYLAHVLGELKASATVSVETMGAFHPSPPDWAESFIELLGRLEASPSLHDLPRQTDLVIIERLVRRRHASPESLVAVSGRDPEVFCRQRRLIAAFLRGCVELPEAVDKALTA